MAKRKLDNESESKEEDTQATAGNLATEEEKVIPRSDSVKKQEAFEKAEVKKPPKQVEEKATLKNSQTTMDIMYNCLDSSSSGDICFKSHSDSCSANVSGDNSSSKYLFDPLNLNGEKQSRRKLVNENEAEKKPMVTSEEAGNARTRRNNGGISRKEIDLLCKESVLDAYQETTQMNFSDQNSVTDGDEANEQVEGQKSPAAGGTTDED